MSATVASWMELMTPNSEIVADGQANEISQLALHFVRKWDSQLAVHLSVPANAKSVNFGIAHP